MTPTQRAAAERLADDLQRFDGAERESLRDEAAALLRELLAEPVINQQMTTELAEPVQEPVAWGVFVDDELFKPFNCKDEAVDWFQAQYNHGSRYDYLVLPLYAAPQQRKPPREQITAAAKALCRQASIACNVDFDDNWKVYGDEYIADATAALNAAHGIGEPT